MTNKKLTRPSDRMIAGVCSGIANYFNLDPTVVRVAYVLLSVCTYFSGLIAYLILWIVIPSDNDIYKR